MGEARPVYVRFPQEIHELLKDVAEKRGESVSDFIRRATLKELVRLGYLPEDYAKALGVRVQPHDLACDGGCECDCVICANCPYYDGGCAAPDDMPCWVRDQGCLACEYYSDCQEWRESLMRDGGEPEEPERSDGSQGCYTCSTSSPAEGLKRALQALKESFEKAGVEVVIFEDAVEALAGEPEVSRAELEALAARRYPGLPLPLAMVKAMNDLWALRTVRPVKGLMWGGVHEENIPDIVAKLVRAIIHGPYAPIRAITVRIEVEDPSCEDYTHFWVEIVDVEKPSEDNVVIGCSDEKR